MSLLLLMLLATGCACCRQQQHADKHVVHVTLQRDTVSAVSCPLKTSENVAWTQLQGGQNGFTWENQLIFTNVQGPDNQLYRCQAGNESSLVNVTVSYLPLNTRDGTIDYCQHGKPCALRCWCDKDTTAIWPGMKYETDVWWGEEWTDVHIEGESPTMISPNVMIADYLRNPTLIGCKTQYTITEKGHELTGLPVGHTLNGRTKNMNMQIIRPYSTIVRPIRKDLRNTVTIPVTVGSPMAIECEGIAWGKYDEIHWLMKPCRGDCEVQFIPEASARLSQQSMNTSLVENVLGYPVSKELVFTSVNEADLKSTFFCKLDSTGVHSTMSVYLKERNAPSSRLSYVFHSDI